MSINRYNELSEQIEQATILALKLRDLNKESEGAIITVGAIGRPYVLLNTEIWKFYYGAIEGATYEDARNREGVLKRIYSYIDPQTGVEYCSNENAPDGADNGGKEG